jgi:hypothetical protein
VRPMRLLRNAVSPASTALTTSWWCHSALRLKILRRSQGQQSPWPAREEGSASPAGWIAPPGMKPAWNWIPPHGIRSRPDLMPRWVRIWFHTPFIDRYAYVWMWYHGGWTVLPPGNSEPGDAAGVREPCGPEPPQPSLAANRELPRADNSPKTRAVP